MINGYCVPYRSGVLRYGHEDDGPNVAGHVIQVVFGQGAEHVALGFAIQSVIGDVAVINVQGQLHAHPETQDDVHDVSRGDLRQVSFQSLHDFNGSVYTTEAKLY